MGRQPMIIRALKMFSIAIYFLFLILFCVRFVVSGKNMVSVVLQYVQENTDIQEEYLDTYYKYGFTKDMCIDLLTGELQVLTAEVMGDKLSVLFHDTETYAYTEEICMEQVSSRIRHIMEENNLDTASLGILTEYTMDISGLSSMFIYDSPAAYKKSVLENTGDVEDSKRMLQAVSVVISSRFLVSLAVMYVICILLLVILLRKDGLRLCCQVADTILYPSIGILAISIGQKFCFSDTSILQDYIFGGSMKVSLVSFFLGILVFALGIALFKKRDKGEIERIEE